MDTIHIPLIDDLVDPRPCLRQKAGYLCIIGRTGQVDLFVSCIDVAADDQLPARLSQFFPMIQDGVVEIHLVFQSILVFFPVGKIYVEQRERGIFNDHRSPFRCKTVTAEGLGQAGRLMARVEAYAAVAFLLGRHPVTLIARPAGDAVFYTTLTLPTIHPVLISVCAVP